MDYSVPWQIGFQFPATSTMLGIIELHNHICFFIIFILVFTFYMLTFILIENSIELLNDKKIFYKVKNSYNIKILHNVSLETLWILLPTFILLAIAIPSFALLYGMEVSRESLVCLKVIGHQWYWSYDISLTNLDTKDFQYILPETHYCFDSFMLYDNEISNKGLRLLETTNPIVLPVKTNIKVLVTSSDVLHSWAIPSFGVKIDACPGRLNHIMLYIDRVGHFYGQCSELCGVNHGFMPIEIYAIPKTEYLLYLTYVCNWFSSNVYFQDICAMDFLLEPNFSSLLFNLIHEPKELFASFIHIALNKENCE